MQYTTWPGNIYVWWWESAMFSCLCTLADLTPLHVQVGSAELWTGSPDPDWAHKHPDPNWVAGISLTLRAIL